MSPKQIFLVHGELESKKDFAKLIGEKFAFHPVVITENSEFELETGELLSREDVIMDAMDDEGIEELKDKISDIKSELDSVLSSTQGVIENRISAEKLQQINNIVLELEKASANLGSSITAEDRDKTPLSQQK